VDRADDKLRTLLHDSTTVENEFHYFCKNSCTDKNITFQRATMFQQKIKQLRSQERDAPALSKMKILLG